MIKRFIKWMHDIKMSYSTADYNSEKVNDYEAKFIATRIFEKYPIEDQHSLVEKISNHLKNLQIEEMLIEKKNVSKASNNIKLLKHEIFNN